VADRRAPTPIRINTSTSTNQPDGQTEGDQRETPRRAAMVPGSRATAPPPGRPPDDWRNREMIAMPMIAPKPAIRATSTTSAAGCWVALSIGYGFNAGKVARQCPRGDEQKRDTAIVRAVDYRYPPSAHQSLVTPTAVGGA